MKTRNTKTMVGLLLMGMLASCGKPAPTISGADLLSWIAEKDTATCAQIDERQDLLLKVMSGKYTARGKNAKLANALANRASIVVGRASLERCSPDMDPAMKQSMLDMYNSLDRYRR